jgi:hypothetical protein
MLFKRIRDKDKYDQELEKPIATNIGYPYNVLPKGYPNKISDKKIEETIEKFLQNLKANAGADAIVNREITFINLGLNELSNRTSRKQARMAFWLSIFSVIIALLSFLVAILK